MPRLAKDKVALEVKDTVQKTSTKKTSTTKSAAKKVPSNSKTTKTVEKSAVVRGRTAKAPVKTTARKTAAKTIKNKIKDLSEYYDLPCTYDKVIIKVLAQTPDTLFVYWEISNKDKKSFEEKFGKDFFSNSRPVLIIKNETKNYSFEVEIHDYANSWYLNIEDSSCKYNIELGRRLLHEENSYVYIASSNEIEAPNDHILFEKKQSMIYFKNVKTDMVTSKNISTLYFIRNIGKIYNIYDLYKKIYQNENITQMDLKNPSSGNPTSTFK